MIKLLKCTIILCIIAILIPYCSNAVDLNELDAQAQEETNRIMSTINEQKSNPEVINSIIVGLFIIVIISMIFESFVRGFKNAIKEKNQNEEDTTDLRKKLWITYGIHIVALIIIFFVCKYVANMINLYSVFFIIISVCMVEVGPFLQIRMRNKNRREDDTTH